MSVDLYPVSATFVKNAGYATQAELAAAQATAQQEEMAALEASLNPTSMGSTPGTTG